MLLDATLGEGGHTIAFLKEGKTVISLERDSLILREAKKKIAEHFPKSYIQQNLTLYQTNYANLDSILTKQKNIDFALFDLGISMFHYKASGRGFSFQKEEPLDMRLDENSSSNAENIINTYSEKEISQILTKYGEEKFAPKIAKKICVIREQQPIKTSKQLAELIYYAVPPFYRHKKIHPATKSFQGLRIFINQELSHISQGITAIINRLQKNGRIAIISYHSLEDRIVKATLKEFVQAKKNINKYRETTSQPLFSSSKVIYPSVEEIKKNKASRSAKMRIFYRNL